jgi:hypothetical protein
MYKVMMIGLALLIFVVTAPNRESAFRSRYVQAQILLDNEIVLEFSTGDDGHPDVDEVWDYLKTKEFSSTEGWAKISKESVLVDSDGNVRFNVRVRISVTYGGDIDFPPGLQLSKTKQGGYLMNAKDVDLSFVGRMISRELASHLKRPRANWDERLKLLDK